MNSWSARTKKQNDVRTRVNSFKEHYRFSENKIKSTSSLHNLAAKLYSDKQNKIFTPAKSSRALPVITSKSAILEQKGKNPERDLSREKMVQSSMGGLSMRTSHISNFSELNTALLVDKKNLEQKIAYLKQCIVNEKHKLAKAQKNCHINTNEVQKYKDLYNDAHLKSQRLQQDMNLTDKDCRRLDNQNHNLNQRIKDTRANIQRQRSWCQKLEEEVKTLKVNSLIEDKNRIKVKAALANAQVTMKSHGIQCKELEDERAFLLLEINQSVSANKI